VSSFDRDLGGSPAKAMADRETREGERKGKPMGHLAGRLVDADTATPAQ
jgi:hypothetical protein